MKKLQPKFVEFKTKDGLTLPGLLYPAKKKGAVCIWLHGNGSSSVFYKNKLNAVLADELSKKGIASLFFNNRGAGVVQKINSEQNGRVKRKLYGMAFERIKECVLDIDSAVSFLKKQGFKKFYLAGHSTGANKICVYNHYKPKNPVSKYVLISGGDDVGIYYQMLGSKKYWQTLKKAKQKISQGKGLETAVDFGQGFYFSHQGFYDIANPNGDYNSFPFMEALKKIKLSQRKLFWQFKKIRKPSMVVYGENDEYVSGSAEKAIKFLEAVNPVLHYELINKADHGYHGKENVLAEVVTKWLNATI